jgi:hypothetical protein
MTPKFSRKCHNDSKKRKDDDSIGPTLWSQQDPQFNTNLPVLDKRDFKSMCDVRKYVPNQTVNWPRCAHGEFCVMQVYQG